MALRPGHREAEYLDTQPEYQFACWRPAGHWLQRRNEWPQHRWRVLDEDDYCEESENGQDQTR